MSDVILRDTTHERCQKRHRWRRFVRADKLSMLIEICEEQEKAADVADYFERFFGWQSKPVKRRA